MNTPPTLPPLGSAPIPRATYRLQFHAGFGFEAATALVPYLQALGVSHLYASPYLKARPGSTHGYDVVDHAALNPEVGSEAQFDQLCSALQQAGLQQLVDVVPNHMGVLGTDNRWWMDVLEHGPASAFAQHFDIDWTPVHPDRPPQLLLPVLGQSYGQVLEAGELQLVYDRAHCGFCVAYHEHRGPIDPSDYPGLLEAAELPAEAAQDGVHRLQLAALSRAFDQLPSRHSTQLAARLTRQRDQAELKAALAQLHDQRPWVRQWLSDCASALAGQPGKPASFDRLDALIQRQAWRMANWRVASDEVNYRRFFDVSTLAALRMEHPPVFEAAHQRLLQWLAEGRIHGLRVDHPDGLADPGAYFRQLQEHHVQQQVQAGVAEPRALYLVIEKILADHEHWPADWPVHGATGYRFATLVNGVFVDAANEAAFDQLCSRFIGHSIDFEDTLVEAKRLIVRSALAADLNMLTDSAYRLAQQRRSSRDFTRNGIAAALTELAAAMPVYRTYIGPAGLYSTDRQHLDWALALAKRRGALAEHDTLDYLHGLMVNAPDEPDGERRELLLRWVTRFQQFTSPVMAKAMEDTAFYRYHRLLSLNDVGGEPSHFGTSVRAFHAANSARERHLPHNLLATSTHDSKRSEDVRARLSVLSELPLAWSQALQRWRELRLRMVGLPTPGPGAEPLLDPNDELLLFQTLVGVWPLEDLAGGLDDSGLAALRPRVQQAMQKSLREAKQHTSWTRPNAAYEAMVERQINSLLSTLEPNPFLSELRRFVARIAPFGAANSLNMLLFKLTLPGVPDIYQGCELWNFSLVDPDNRRPVDFGLRQQQLAALQADWGNGGSGPGHTPGLAPGRLDELRAHWTDGRLKLFLTWRLLQLRQARPALFQTGAYRALDVQGPASDHAVACLRELPAKAGSSASPANNAAQGERCLVVGSRLLWGLAQGDADALWSGQPLAGWQDSVLCLPDDSPVVWQDQLTGQLLQAEDHGQGLVLPLAKLLSGLPWAVCLPLAAG